MPRSRPSSAGRAIWLLGLASACGGATVSGLRFHNHSPITAVDDERAIVKPEERERSVSAAQVDALLRLPLDHALAIPGPQRARDINSLDEVPRSSWFAPRIGAHLLTPQDVARGPSAQKPGMELEQARFKVWKVKSAGTAPGLMVEDAVGTRHLLKIDPGAPEAETGAEVVVQRLLWAAGYQVPRNEVAYLARDQLELDAEAEIDRDAVDRVLANAPRDDRGRARVLLSELLPGEPVGGFPMIGVRPDDRNDRIPHEHRRSLRALELFFAWLGQTDVKEANTLDTWIPIAEGSDQGYVRHHQLDFGKSLGVWGLTGRERDGFAPHFDYANATSSLFSFGLERWPWEGLRAPELRGVGRFEAHRFDPAHYSPANPYAPFLYTDRFDRYWAAKIIARFSAEHLRAAITAARYSDEAARAYLLQTLIERQRRVVRYGFAEVSTLDDFAVQDARRGRVSLCARDLAIAVGFTPWQRARYAVRVYDWDGTRLATRSSLANGSLQAKSKDGKICAGDLPIGESHEGYTMIAYEAQHAPPFIVVAHLAREPGSGHMRLVGVERR
jgi:hypothetical protein